MDVLVAVVGGQSDNVKAWHFLGDPHGRLDSAQSRETQIHQDHVGAVFSTGGDRLLAVAGLRNHRHVGFRLEDSHEPGAKSRVIVDHEQANAGWA